MKFWQKTFIVLLSVFIVTIDLCATLMMHFTYQQQLENMKEKGSSETYFITANISEDLADRSASGTLSAGERNNLFETYSQYYIEQGIILSFYEGSQALCGNISQDLLEYAAELEVNEQQFLITEMDNEKYLCVISRLAKPYDDYTLFYRYSLKKVTQSHERLLGFTVGMVVGITIMLAVSLYWILKHLTKPLKKLEEGVIAIGDGKYGDQIKIEGSDEFAELGDKFDQMSCKISDQIEELTEADRKKQLLIDNMAHEFRTPLTSISGYASYLKVAVTSEDERLEALDYIISESERLQKLSKIILRSAEMREEEIKFEQIEVKTLLERVKENSLGYAHEKQASLVFNTQVEHLIGNSVLVESLLINLVENALRACEEGCGQVIVSVLPDEEGVVIKVSDNGIGMAEEEIKKISEPFYRVDKARSRKAGGVGLGVSLCQQIVKLHKGKMIYTSEPGKGTTVSVKFFS